MRCKTCDSLKTCIHDERCVHDRLLNRQNCPRCESQGATLDTRADEQIAMHAQAINDWRRSQNMCPLPTPQRTKKLRTFQLSEKAFIGILQIAQGLGYVHNDSRKPNPTLFLEALGQHLLNVTP